MNEYRIDYDALPQVQFLVPRLQIYIGEANPLSVDGDILEAVAQRTGLPRRSLTTKALPGGSASYWVQFRDASGRLQPVAVVSPGKEAR